jgi:hypothetical protein
MSLVDENKCRVQGASNRTLKVKGNSCRSLYLGSKVASCRSLYLGSKAASCRSLYLGMTEEDNGEAGTTSDSSTYAKANDASQTELSNESCENVIIPEKRGPPKAPKSLNVKEFLVENQIPPPVTRKVSYLQLEMSLACDIVEDDAESGWAFKTPTTNVESGPQQPPTTSALVHMRAVWCLV